VPVMMGDGVLIVFWLMLYWMAKTRILIRI
jgi:hypothetical protein